MKIKVCEYVVNCSLCRFGSKSSSPSTQAPDSTPELPAAPESPPDLSSSLWNLWFLSILETIAISLIAYQTGAMLGFVRWGIRWGFSAFIGGLFTYNYLVLKLPGSSWFFASDQAPMKFGLFILGGAVIGWALSFVFHKFKPLKLLS